MFKKKDKILVVVAHPDDEVLGCGGAILIAKKTGCEVNVICLGEGVSSRFKNFDSINRLKAHNKRISQFKSCIKRLKINDFILEDRLCNQFDNVSLLSIVKSIEIAIKKFKPNIILTHNEFEVNIDHKITHQAVETAVRPVKESTIEKVYSFEIPCSGNWTLNKKFLPNTYLNIKSVWKDKIEAWKIYKDEIRPFPFPRSIKSLQTIAHYRGLQSGLELAEAYKLERSIF